MKRIVVSVAIILVIMLTTLTLQGCFTPYPEGVHRATPDRDMTEDMRRPWP